MTEKISLIQNSCLHKNWVPVGYQEEGDNYFRVQSIYDVFCYDCSNFINLLSGDIIDGDGLKKIKEIKNGPEDS